jgi:hypothetical protein
METQTGLLNIRLAELLKFHLPKTPDSNRFAIIAQPSMSHHNVLMTLPRRLRKRKR